MTENEYLQKQINLLFNALLNFKSGYIYHMLDSAEMRRESLNEWGRQFEQAFNNLEATYEAAAPAQGGKDG